MKDLALRSPPTVTVLPPPAATPVGAMARLASNGKPHWCNGTGWDELLTTPFGAPPSVYEWRPGTGTTASVADGVAWTIRTAGTGATQLHSNPAATTPLDSMNRAGFSTGSTATGSSGVQSARPLTWRGNSPGLGGFRLQAKFGLEAGNATLRVLVGLSALNAPPTAEPDSLNNTLALAKLSSSPNWQLVVKGTGAATVVNTGLPVVVGEVISLSIHAPPNGTSVFFSLTNPVSGALLFASTVATSLPASDVFLYAHAAIRSQSGSAVKRLGLGLLRVESNL